MAHHDDDAFEEYVEESPEPFRTSQRLLIIVLGVGCFALAISNVVLAVRVTELRRALNVARATSPADTMERPATESSATERPATEGRDGGRAGSAPATTTESTATASAPQEQREAVASAIPPQRAPEVPAAASPPAPAPSPTERATSVERSASNAAAPAASVASAPAAEPAPAPAKPEPAPAPAKPEPAPAPAKQVAKPAPPPAKLDLPPRAQAREQARVASATRTTERERPVAPSTPERQTASWMVQEYGRVDAETRARAVAEFYGAHSPDGAYWRRVLAEITRR